MNYLTKEKFLEQVKKLRLKNPEHWGHEEYHLGQPKSTDRWSYHEKAVEIAKRINPETVLEAGTMGIQICEESDSIDIEVPEWNWRLTYQPTYKHDLTLIPWADIQDKQYDLFIALRVFHHMNNERKYIKEMQRISNHIILAFPQYASDKYESILKPTEKYHFSDTDTTIIYYKI